MTFPTVIAPILQAATLAALWHDAAAEAAGGLPLPMGPRPLQIDAGIYMDDFFGIDIESNSFKVDFWLSLRWNDPRNAFNLSDPNSPPEPRLISKNNQEDTLLWLPDMTMTNSDPGFEPTISNLLIYPNGTVVWMRRMVLHFEANAHFDQFPFDWHSLEMKLESKAYYSSDIALQPWFHMTGHKSEKKSSGSYIWNILQFDPPRSSCGDLCADSVCSAICEETASDEKQTLLMSQFIKDSFSGAPDGSMLSSATFKKYRLVITLKVARMMGNLALSYFLPSTLLMMITMLSFLPDCSDLGTRLGASLVGLLTFEVMAERVDGKIPGMERITWITVWHAFHVLLLTSVVLENGLTSYIAVHTYKTVARTIDRFAIVLFALWYVVGILIMFVNQAAENPTSLLIGIIAFVFLGQLLLLSFAWVSKSATDRIILSRLVGSSQLRQGRYITWAVVDRIVSWRQRDGHRDRSWRCCRRTLVHTGLRFDGLFVPDSALMGWAFERIARRVHYMDEPMAAVLSEDEFIRGLWKTFGCCLPTSSSGTSNEFVKAVRTELKGRSVVFIADGSDGGTDRPISFKDSNLLKLIFTAAGTSTSI